MQVTLTPAEMLTAAVQGAARYITNLRDRRRDKHGSVGDSTWATHIEGVCGEIALAKVLGVYWSNHLARFDTDDVGALQVRTRPEAWHELIVHKHDRDDRVFVLLLGRAPTFRVAGWIRGADAKQATWWKDPAGGRPAFFVPQESLVPGLPPREAWQARGAA